MKILALGLLASIGLWAQQTAPQSSQVGVAGPALPQTQAAPQSAAMQVVQPSYVLAAGDQLQIRALEVNEIGDRPYPIDSDGFVLLPLIGKIKVGGMTLRDFETLLVERLRTYVRQPQVIVGIAEFRSAPVFFVGAFKAPGIYSLQGRRTLLEMLSANGGLAANASKRLKLHRRKEYGNVPLPRSTPSADGSGFTADINLGSLDSLNPTDDIELQPYDVIAATHAEPIYVSGEVGKVGSVEMGERDYIPVSQIVIMAGGATRNADTKRVKILRPVLNTSRRAEIEVDMDRVLAGKETDVLLMSRDMLHVPTKSGLKRNLGRSMWVAAPLAVTLGLTLAR